MKSQNFNRTLRSSFLVLAGTLLVVVGTLLPAAAQEPDQIQDQDRLQTQDRDQLRDRVRDLEKQQKQDREQLRTQEKQYGKNSAQAQQARGQLERTPTSGIPFLLTRPRGQARPISPRHRAGKVSSRSPRQSSLLAMPAGISPHPAYGARLPHHSTKQAEPRWSRH